MKINYAYLSVFILIFVSGCSYIPGGVIGADVISLNQRVVNEAPRDVVVVSRIVATPSPPLLPDQEVSLSVVVENKDELKNAKRLVVDLFNAPGFKSGYRDSFGSAYYGSLCNQIPDQPLCLDDGASVLCDFDVDRAGRVGPCQPSGLLCGPLSPCSIIPGEQKNVIFQLISPNEQEIANIRTETSLDLRTTYEFDGALTFIAPVVSIDEIVRLQTEGKKLSVDESRLYASGPIIIDVEVLGAKYLLSSTPQSPTEPQKSRVRFKIQNKGSGSIVNSRIEAYNIDGSPFLEAESYVKKRGMMIVFPPELTAVPSQANFRCVPDARLDGTYTMCTNTDKIDIFQDESRVSLLFDVTPNRLPSSVPFISSTIQAFVWYEYELRDNVKITVNPFQNT